MSFEVRCQECGDGWIVEHASGGEMICPGCMTRIPLERAQPTPTETQDRTVATRSEPTSSREGEVVCPRCNFHFHSHERSAAPDSAPRQTILVVDDLAYFRKIALDALSPVFDVKTAATHDEAWSILEAGGIDLVVLDLTLDGGKGGRQLLTRLDPKPCPILIFTAEDESEMYGETWEELTRLGADDIVIKGMNVADVLVRKAGTLLGTPADEDGVIK
jgi:CheY-like chemotaxis protein